MRGCQKLAKAGPFKYLILFFTSNLRSFTGQPSARYRSASSHVPRRQGVLAFLSFALSGLAVLPFAALGVGG